MASSVRDLTHWFAEEGGVAALWNASGPLRRESVVPQGTCALPLDNDDRLLETGRPLTGRVLLLRDEIIRLSLTVPGLTDRNGVRGTLRLMADIDPPRNKVSALLLRDQCLSRSESLDEAELTRRLEPIVTEYATPIVQSSPWQGDDGAIARLRGAKPLQKRLRETLFEMGMSLLRVSDVNVHSAELDERCHTEERLRRETQRVRERLEFIELWKREELGEKLARDEVEKVAAHLQREGLLRRLDKEHEILKRRLDAQREEEVARNQLRRMLERERIAVQMEIDAQRLESEVARAKRLKEALDKHGLVALLESVNDPGAKARLLELLAEKEMTPDQIAARTESRGWERVEQRLADLARQLRGGLEEDPTPPWAEELRPMARVWLAAGLALYRIDGPEAFHDAQPTPVLPPQGIGYLRSLRVHRGSQGQDSEILVGGQAGVGLYQPQGSFWQVYRYRTEPRGRGGANSILIVGPYLLATHSELGLQIWDVGSPESGRPLFPAEIVPGRPTRGVQLGPGGGVFFSHGASVYSLDPLHPDTGLRSRGKLPDSVTAIAARGDSLLAGTRDGRLFTWEAPDRWRESPLRTVGPVFRISPLGNDPVRGWVVGARQPAAHVLDAAGRLVAEYRTRNPVRWVAAARDGIVGVDRFGDRLLLWRWQHVSAPARTIRIPDQVHYVVVEEGES